MTPASALATGPRAVEIGYQRLRAYLACLIAAFSLYVVINAVSQGIGFFLVCAVILAALVLSLFSTSRRGGRVLPFAATLAAACVAVIAPLAGLVAQGASLPAAVGSSTVWPQILVTLFAGRVLAELSEIGFIDFWRSPLAAGHARPQSMLAAVVTGLCLTLLFYQFVGGLAPAPERLDPSAITMRALAGKTVIHSAIVLLFFVILAAIIDAALLALNDRLALEALRRAFRTRAGQGRSPARDEIATIAAGELAPFSHTRAIQFVLDAAGQPGLRRPLEAFHLASRRLIRALTSFLPLLGFLGTVIGLTAAIGGLPANLGPQAQGNLDISASLLGLAVKFETTLLGLLGALIASLLLSLLEKREGELAAECATLVEAFSRDG